MEILIKAGQLILSLSILVILHEFGHFAFARLFKTRVEKFYLFFDAWFALFKFKKGETEYGIGWLPLGGYVKISGMIDESMDTEAMKEPPKPYEFRSKKSWQRLLIMLGGVMVNFLLAIIIYVTTLYVWGDEYLPNENVKYGIWADSLAQSIGFENGDKVVSLDGEPVENFFDIHKNILLDDIQNVQVKRDGEIKNINITGQQLGALIKTPMFISPRFPFVAGKFVQDAPAKEAGMQEGDKIIAVNDSLMPYFDQYSAYLDNFKNETVQVTRVRNNDTATIPVQLNEDGKLGIYPAGFDTHFSLETREYGVIEAIPAGISKGFNTLQDYLKQFKLIFNSETEAYKEVGGFMKIGSIFPGTWNWEAFWNLTAFLSIMLAFLNVLPIPALDGGHVLFLVYEMVTGRKPSDKFLEYAQIVGLVILFSLILYANGNDIYNFIIKDLFK